MTPEPHQAFPMGSSCVAYAGLCYNQDESELWPDRGEMRQVVIYRGENGYWVAECPSLPGCISQGRTKEEAVANIREAIQAYIEVLEEDGLPMPLVGALGFTGGTAKR